MLRLLILAAALLAPTLLCAQVELGDRVRVKSGSGSLSGWVIAVTDSTVTLAGSTDALGLGRGTRTVELATLDRMELSVSQRSRGEGALRGAAAGLVSGAAAGAVVFWGMTWMDDCDPKVDDLFCFTPEFALLMGAGIGGYYGTLSGAVIGLVWPGDRWQRTPFAAPRAAVLATGDGRAGVGVTLRF